MTYWKLSIRNAKRSFINYLLYIAAMTVLLATIEISNCIAIIGALAGFQVVSLPLLITAVQIVLAEYMNTFIFRQRAKEFANYLLLGMERKQLARLFLCEVLWIGVCCYLAGATAGFILYGLWYFRALSHAINVLQFLYVRSMLYTFAFFCLIETVCSFRLYRRLNRLQIRELMCEKNRSQCINHPQSRGRWGGIFCFCFACLIGCVYGIAFLPETYVVYPLSVAAVPLLAAIFAFYKWVFGCLYARRKEKAPEIYQKDRLYIAASITSNLKTSAMVNAVFCVCFLFSACAFITGVLMLQPELRIFDTAAQQWMGISQISICIVFLVIYFSILSLQQMIELRQNFQNNQIMRCMGKSDKQIRKLIHQQIAIKLLSPMIMAVLAAICCIPLLNRKMNLILPAAMKNILVQLAGIFLACTACFYLCFFGIAGAVSKRYIRLSDGKKP